MITIEQRLELLKGGYTAEQIEQFAQQEQQQQPQQQQQPTQPEQLPGQLPQQPEQKPQQPEQQPQQPEQDPGKDALQLIRDLFASNQEVSQNMAKLTAAIQANALAGAGLPGGANNPTAEQALASIIAPEMKERR